MKCPRCQQENPASQKFCGQCGSPLATADGVPYADLPVEIERLKRSLTESLEQQTATGEILSIISRLPTDVQPVLEAVAESVARLCDSPDVSIFRIEGVLLHLAVHRGPIGSLLPYGQERVSLERGSVVGRSVIERRTIHVSDLSSETEEYPEGSAHARRFGHRTALSVPLLRGDVAIGAIAVRRIEARLFTTRQVALLQTFADQAVIAIENMRLFTELQEKNQALTTAHAQVSEALEQQTATSEILKVISRSPTDMRPVFETIVESAVTLCEAAFGALFRYDGQLITIGVMSSQAGSDERAILEQIFPTAVTPQGRLVGRAIRERQVVQIEDVQADVEALGLGMNRRLVDASGYRTFLAVPLLRGDVCFGVINVWRRIVAPFSEQHIALLKTFADQAVIAIENVRLFTELQTSNKDLREALDTQTATSEILRVISSSRADLQPVVEIMAERAAGLCDAAFAAVFRFDGEWINIAALSGLRPDERDAALRYFPRRPTPGGFGLSHVVLTGEVAHIPDVQSDPAWQAGTTGPAFSGEGFRTCLIVPLVREGVCLGAINVWRREPAPFSERHIELLKTFADQAVIAIENVRLFRELQARTGELTRSVEQLTALGEVSRAVSSTLDLETVLTTIVERAVSLSGLDGGVVFEYEEGSDEFVHRAATEAGGALAEARRATRVRKGEGVVGQTAITLEPAQVPDIGVPGAYEGRLRQNLLESGIRAVLAVPMIFENRLIGCLVVSRDRPGEFPAGTIELLRTFAVQSALAIQNARLFREIEQKSRELEAASRHKSEFLANMSHELRTPLNAVIGFSEVLNERMFGELNEKQADYLKDIHASGQHLLSLINDILDLSKIEAGRMELELSDFNLPVTLENALTLVRERAGRHGVTLAVTVDQRLEQIRADERKIRQVVLNLLSNAIKFTPAGGRIELRAVPTDGSVEVSVTDTGVGIAPEDQDAIFEEFKQVGTAAKKVEGTGLGLALSRKFIELHGGRIWVKSQVGTGSTFTFTIPVRHGE